MKMRWLAAGITAVLITGGAATVAQRVITQKTRGVLPEKNDAAHADSRPSTEAMEVPRFKGKDSGQPVPDRPETSISSHPLPALELPPESSASLVPGPSDRPEPAPQILSGTVPEPASPALDASTDPAINPASASPIPTVLESAPEPAPSAVVEVQSKADPVDTVDTFVERNRKEAESAIQTLGAEAEALKTRLTKVETALGRWQNFSRALNADQPVSQSVVGPSAKLPWRKPDNESSPRPTEPSQPDQPGQPVPDLIPQIPNPEVSAPKPVPTREDLPVPPPTNPRPPELPRGEPPSASIPSPN